MSKTIYILGAGFSYEAGIPLQNQILSEIFAIPVSGSANRKNSNYLDRYRTVFAKSCKGLKEYLLDTLYVDPIHLSQYSLEDLFSTFDLIKSNSGIFKNLTEIELYKIETGLKFQLILLFYTKIRKGLKDVYINAFAKYLLLNENTCSVISMNWDSLLENKLINHLNKNSLKLDYGLNEDMILLDSYGKVATNNTFEFSALKFLKLHGSFNWVKCPNCKRIYSSKNQIAQKVTLKEIICPICLTDAKLSINLRAEFILPTFLKDFQNYNYQLIWNTAAREIEKADKICFIGYSLPQSDYHFRFLISKAIRRDVLIDVVLAEVDNPEFYTKREFGNLPHNRFINFLGNRTINFHYDGAKQFINSIVK